MVQIRQNMEKSLELLVNLHRDENFFHALLQKNFQAADLSPAFEPALKNRIQALQKTFPGAFRFIVWNKNGQINQRLSQEKSFQYVLKSMFQVSNELLKTVADSSDTPVQELPEVQQKIKLLRGYFGQFLLPELMVEFFKPKFDGKAITVSEIPEKRKLWVYVGRHFALAAFISAEVLKERIGPKLLVKNFNGKSKNIRLGYFTSIEYRNAGLPKNPDEIREIRLEARKFQENAISFRQSRNFQLLFRQVSPELVVFTYLRNKDRIDPSQNADFAIAALLKWLLIGVFVFYCYSLNSSALWLTVQQKFMLLLFFANGLPVLILFSTGYEYFREKTAAIIDAKQQESMRILRELDARFPIIRRRHARLLNDYIDQKNEQFKAEKWPQSEFENLEKIVSSLEPARSTVLGREGEIFMNFNKRGLEQGSGFYKEYLQRSLEFACNNDLKRRGEDGGSTLESISSEDSIYLSFLSELNKMTLQNTGSTEHWVFNKLLGDFRSFKSWGIFSSMWTREDLLHSFVREELVRAGNEVLPRRMAIMEIDSRKILPSDFPNDQKLERLLQQAEIRREILHENLEFEGQIYLLCAIRGIEIQEGILFALYPRSLIENEISGLKRVLFVTGLIILLVLWQIVRLFSQRLLTPVEGLSLGIEELKNRNFRHRIPITGDDELGKLTSAFNDTMESLQELAVGTAVQESLLPEERFRSGRLTLFARSMFMTKMGGDYFDYFESEPGKLGIIFGDVAGHGIPAAIIMAMAKAVVASASVSFKTPADMLAQANQVLLRLKEKKLRRMMTCQCLDLNAVTGELTMANAGHCYPILIKKGGKECSFLVTNGTPLGNKIRKAYEEKTFQLEPGDVLVLYTDGIVEAANQSEEMFGYDRFFQLLKESFDTDLEKFWQGIIEGNQKWAATQDDDLTFMIIRYDND